jgi:putative oxidoreductase
MGIQVLFALASRRSGRQSRVADVRGSNVVFDWDALRLTWEPRMRSILRIVVGLLFFEHGTGKLLNFPPAQTARPYALFTLTPGLAGLLEFFGGILVILGLFTRPVAFILSGEMAFAYFMSHAPRGFFPIAPANGGNGGELAIIYCFTFLYFFVVGAGAWSVDAVWAGRARGRVGAAGRA